MSDMRYDGKVAVVTGAGQGLGRSHAMFLASRGAKVVVNDLGGSTDGSGASRTPAQKVCDEIKAAGGTAVANYDSVSSEAGARAIIDAAVKAYGRIDILVNNAGITQPVKTLEITGADYDRILDVSLRGTLYMSQAVLPAMRQQQAGSIVCISSVSAQRGGGIFGGPHYSAAKAGVLGLARAMAREFGPEGIRINCITPGLIETDITQGKLSPEQKKDIAQTIPLNRLGRADDVAGVCVFLGSDLSAYCTGVTLDVNGGMLIH